MKTTTSVRALRYHGDIALSESEHHPLMFERVAVALTMEERMVEFNVRVSGF